MSHWICCNSCFHSPSAERKLAVTTCGHLICNVCFQKGTPGTCLICNAKCQVSPLSDKCSSEVKALFCDIGTLAKKHLGEINKVMLFQARHQKRLLSYYQQRNDKLEQTMAKMKQEMEKMLKKHNEQSAHIQKLEKSLQHLSVNGAFSKKIHSSSHTPHGHQTVMQIPFNSPMLASHHSSTTNLNMETEETNLFRKPSHVPRLRLRSPQQDGQKGTVPNRIANQNMLVNHSAISATPSRFQTTPLTPEMSFNHPVSWKSPIFKTSSTFRHPSMSPLNNFPL